MNFGNSEKIAFKDWGMLKNDCNNEFGRFIYFFQCYCLLSQNLPLLTVYRGHHFVAMETAAILDSHGRAKMYRLEMLKNGCIFKIVKFVSYFQGLLRTMYN